MNTWWVLAGAVAAYAAPVVGAFAHDNRDKGIVSVGLAAVAAVLAALAGGVTDVPTLIAAAVVSTGISHGAYKAFWKNIVSINDRVDEHLGRVPDVVSALAALAPDGSPAAHTEWVGSIQAAAQGPVRYSMPNGGTLTYLSRADWNAGPLEAGAYRDPNNFKAMVLHHTPALPEAMGVKPGDVGDAIRFMQRLQEVRPDLGNEVPYSWVMFQGATPHDSIVCEGRGPNRSGAHTANINSARYGIAAAQNTDSEPLTPGQIEAFRWLAANYLTATDLEPTAGHSDFANISALNNTECPGDNGRAALGLLQPPFDAVGNAPDTAPVDIGVITQQLKRGDRGAQVGIWQRTLIDMGHPLPLFGADEAFGGETENATKDSEISMGLAPDGVVSVEQARLARQLVEQQTETDLPGVFTELSTNPDPAVMRALEAAERSQKQALTAIHDALDLIAGEMS